MVTADGSLDLGIEQRVLRAFAVLGRFGGKRGAASGVESHHAHLYANSAVSILLLPLFVRALKAEGHAGFYRLVRLTLMFFALGSVVIRGLLLLFRTELLPWIYGGRYAEYADLLALAGLLPLPMAVTFVSSSALMAMELPDQIFWCHVVATFITITLGLSLSATHGVAGAVIGGLASWFTAAVVVTREIWRKRMQEMLMPSEIPVQDR